MYRPASDRCVDGLCTTRARDALDRDADYSLAADVALVAGTAFLAAGVTLFVISLADDVMIGQDVTVFCINNNAEACATDLTGTTEGPASFLRNTNVDDSRRCGLNQGRQTGHRLSTHACRQSGVSAE